MIRLLVATAGLLLVAPIPRVDAQSARGDPATTRESFSLQPAFPNPFHERTRIPFILGSSLFDAGERARVSMRVFNLLHQVVATPRLLPTPGMPGGPLEDRPFRRPGSYEAEWDGRDVEGQPVRPGPYFVQLEVNGRAQVRKLLVTRDEERGDEGGGDEQPGGAGSVEREAAGAPTERGTGSARSSGTRRSARSVPPPTPTPWARP